MFDSRTIRRLESPHWYTPAQCAEIFRSDCGDVAPHPIESRRLVGHDSTSCFVSDLRVIRAMTDDSSMYTTGRIVANFMQKALDTQSYALAMRYRADLTTIQSCT